MREFHAGDWFQITGRGWAAAFTADQFPEDIWDPSQLNGETVLIDRIEYVVKAVERNLIYISPERPYRGSFGILVGERLTDVPSSDTVKSTK
jgi:hypothetical protein